MTWIIKDPFFFANVMSKDCGIEIIPTKTAKKVAISSDIIITATTAKEPVIQEQWLKKGTLYSNVSGYEYTFETV